MQNSHHDTKNHMGSGHFREKPFEKSLDKHPKQYDSSETVPQDSFSAEPLNENFENPGDLSKRFV